MAAMYTKMTATGSSLIVAPRTISKELETRIATAIATVIAKHDMAQLTTKLVRQAVEKEVKVSLTNHKEVLKRLMHQEVRRMKAEKAVKRPVQQPWKIKTRVQCMLKGLRLVYNIIRGEELKQQADELLLHSMQSLFDQQAVEVADVARLARTFMRMLGAKWLQRPFESEWPNATLPSAQQVVEMLVAVYSVERLGISHPRRVELLEFIERSPPIYGPMDFFGWNPVVEAPKTAADDSSFKRMTNVLLQCWYAHSLQVSLGCTMSQVFQHLPTFYPYKSSPELSETEYRDQVHMVTTVVLILTRFGALRCEPELLPHEYSFLRQHLVVHIVRQDIHLVGEILRALRCFDGSDNLISVRRGMALIMLSQKADGTWSGLDRADSRDQKFYTTMSALFALSEPRTIGFAPSIPEAVSVLELHLNADLPSAIVEDEQTKPTLAAVDRDVEAAATATSNAAAPSTGRTRSATLRNTGDAAQPESVSARETMSDEELETQVRFLQSMLEKDGDNVKNVSETLAMHVLTTLSAMKLNVEILKNTGVGRVINKLRKHSGENVAKSATQLVAKWKKDLL